MARSRQEVCELTSRQLAAASPTLPSLRAMIGLDGFVDEIIAVVETRHDNDRYDRVPTIAAFGQKVCGAAGESSNYELVVTQMKIGGNGPIMANALARLGLDVTYVGNLGHPNLHPVFEEFAQRAKVISIAEPGHTDALEFQDGKLMLGKVTPLNDVHWDNLVNRLGCEGLRDLVGGSQLIGMVNWTMLPHMTEIWARLLDEVLPTVERRDRIVFIDLADPEKRTARDILDALGYLTRFQDHADVILGLNLKESMEVAEVLGLAEPADPEAAIEATAAAIRRRLDLGCVVIHPRRGAAAATATQSAAFAGPFVIHPKISTGAGDHFNAGFCLARVLGLGLEESLCVGVAASGAYVRTGDSPTAEQLAGFIATLPLPQDA